MKKKEKWRQNTEGRTHHGLGTPYKTVNTHNPQTPNTPKPHSNRFVEKGQKGGPGQTHSKRGTSEGVGEEKNGVTGEMPQSGQKGGGGY